VGIGSQVLFCTVLLMAEETEISQVGFQCVFLLCAWQLLPAKRTAYF